MVTQPMAFLMLCYLNSFVILTKSLLPPPDKYLGLTDIDKRDCQRCVDMIANPMVAGVFRKRAKGGIEDGEEPTSIAIWELHQETGIVFAEIIVEMASSGKVEQLEHSIWPKHIIKWVLHHASMQDPPNSDDEVGLDYEYLNSGVHVSLDKDEYNVAPDIVERVTHSGKQSIEFSDRKKKKEPRSMQIGEAIQAFVETSKAREEAQLAKAERWRSRSKASIGSASNSYSVSACVAILSEMDLSNDIYVKAMKQFKEPINKELFMAVPLDRKRA